MDPKNPKYSNFLKKTKVIPAAIRPETGSKTPILVPSTTRRALSTGVFKFCIAQTGAPKIQNIGFSLWNVQDKNVIPAAIGVGSCSKTLILFPSTTR
jgi:hypothetical protein